MQWRFGTRLHLGGWIESTEKAEDPGLRSRGESRRQASIRKTGGNSYHLEESRVAG